MILQTKNSSLLLLVITEVSKQGLVFHNYKTMEIMVNL